MPTCNGKTSAALLRANFYGNRSRERKYEAEYCWRNDSECCAICFLKGCSGIYPQDQVYEGHFFRDSLHGQGNYKWKDSAAFEGTFYSNYKEGYAIVSYHNNCHFEGLFVKNKPFGPGIFTYANGRQDAGFWMGRKLVRLSRAADYIIPRLAPTSVAKIKLLQFRRLISLDDTRESADDILGRYSCLSENCSSPYSTLIYDPRSFFFDTRLFDKTYFVTSDLVSKDFANGKYSTTEEYENRENEREECQIPPHCLCSQDEVDICEGGSSTDSQTGILYNLTKHGMMERPSKTSDEEEALNVETGETGETEDERAEEGSNLPKIVSWNRSELCTEMLKQIFRHRAFEDRLNFNIAKLMLGARTAFRRTGIREKECLHFLKMCSLGPIHIVKDLLCDYGVSEELMDARGNNSLMFAAAADQLDIIDALLDYGVDVNTFNDEGLTPLNLCLLRRLAQANNISNWEAAFLPKETDQALVPEAHTQNDTWGKWESIPSLDRVFGDGMSMNDSRTLLVDNRFLTPINSPSLTYDNCCTDDSRHTSDRSQITVLQILKSPRTNPTNSSEDISQQLHSARSQAITNRSRFLASNEPTPRADVKMIPKSNKRDEFEKSIAKTDSEKYLFEFSFEKKPQAVVLTGKKLTDSTKSTATKGKDKKPEPVKEEVQEVPPNLESIAKIREIDKTIEKLLIRGADPNISEVPKPSIHLGIYTKDVTVVRLLLMHGASPNSQLYPNEGLLTPLHVLVLLKSSQEFVSICEMLLSFGANVEEETRPEFSICEEEKSFLDSERGRTPLQLLCMRPDVEYADPGDHLIKIALMLANVSNNKHYYNGHSCLTLAMHSANLKVLKALLSSQNFDPNALLGNDLGTALHVLVSTEFQKKTFYDMSIQICDILLAAGANPTQEFKRPAKLSGTCVDYGYREIEAEKSVRKVPAGKKDNKSGKEKAESNKGRDHLKDHERVMEYLKEVVRKIKSGVSDTESKSRTAETGKRAIKSSEDSRRVTLSKTSGRDSVQGKEKDASKLDKENKQKKGESADLGRQDETADNEVGKSEPKKVSGGKKKETEGGEGGERTKEGKKSRKMEIVEENTRKKKTEKREKESKDRGSKGNKDLERLTGRTESNLLKDKTKPSTKSLNRKARSETFPEKVRQNLLRMFGTCVNIDVNELLLPYVVLRDGELYYRFHGRETAQKEQYSLI